jgi:NAD(P)-dependent dehydrogenase (short-subunit alcohol dehydrogenase family)
MSFAQKVWLGRGRILMQPTQGTGAENRSKRPLDHAVALVTGGSRGIGRAIAARLAALGAAVAICSRDSKALNQASAELTKFGARVFAYVADVTRRAEVEALVAKTEAALGPVSILVNNAGIGVFGPTHEKSEEDWDKVINTNLKSMFLTSKAVVPAMIARNGGDIVNISSLAGLNAFAGGGIYCASKWGVQGLSACMAEDLRAYGIRVSTVCPGSVATEFSGSGPKDASKVLSAEDVAHAVEMIVTQSPKSFVSQVQIRPLSKPGKS